MGTVLTRKRQIAAKIEVTEGTEETLAAADGGLLIIDPKWEPDVTQFERSVVSDTFSPFRMLPGQQKGEISFSTEVKGSGSAGVAPALGKYLRACGFKETVVGATSVTYAPLTDAVPSITIALYTGDDAASGLKKTLRGARGAVKFSVKAGEPMMAEFVFAGVQVVPTDNAPLVAVNYEDTEPPVMLSAAFAIQGLSAKILQLAIDMGNVVSLRDDVSTAEGFFSAMLTGRRPVGSFDPEETLVATHDWYTILKNGTEGAMNYVMGATAGNIVTVNAPKAQYTKISEGERNGLATYAVDLAFNRSADVGNDELTIVLT